MAAAAAMLAAAAASRLTATDMGLRRDRRQASAIAVASGVFGIWHLRPTVEALRINRPTVDRRPAAATVTAAVAATTVGGVVLSWLRVHSGSLAAPHSPVLGHR